MRDNAPWFVAADIAAALGYSRARDAIQAHCKGAVKYRIPTTGGVQMASIIPERDVYRLIMRSKLPQAEQFEEWVVAEVLPSIRKTGGYIQAGPEDTPETIMAKAVLVADKTIKELHMQNVHANAGTLSFWLKNVRKTFSTNMLTAQ
ncbi:hypothetical protein B9G39_00195 [Zooshikella ganghwensis]|uniref:Bro-N domain-containing protein n=2 Tax=Zooshikella ganghwensis TaxID=202772 RepID=A0A4P9VSI9_9GAMM|nr:hypothetical protein B9G39_00195 [Zooshikella ganghwensis]